MSQADTVAIVTCSTDKDMIRESVSKMKNGNNARPSGLVSEMVKVARETGVSMITDLVNQIFV